MKFIKEVTFRLSDFTLSDIERMLKIESPLELDVEGETKWKVDIDMPILESDDHKQTFLRNCCVLIHDTLEDVLIPKGKTDPREVIQSVMKGVK